MNRERVYRLWRREGLNVPRTKRTKRRLGSSANGPEFIAMAVRAWASGAGVGTLDIEPGSPWENGSAESFNSQVRDELWAVEEFTSLLEAQVLGRQWKPSYHHERPHRSVGDESSTEYASGCPRLDAAGNLQGAGHNGTD